MKKLLSIIIISWLAVPLFFTLAGQQFQEAAPAAVNMSPVRLARIDAVIRQAVDSGWIAGADAFIARDGKIIYNKAFGLADAEKKTPMETNSIFRIASQTKAITSVAAMILFEEGKFLLDDPVSKYIPEFAHPGVIDKYNPADTTYTTVPAKREITVRDLLTHTSGIEYAGIGSDMMRAIYAKAGIPGGFGAAGPKIGDKMKALGRMPLLHNPGEKFTYGLNVDVVGYLVEIWSGESLDHFMRTHIFEPLGMSDTYFYLPQSKYDRLVRVSTFDSNHRLIASPNDYLNYPKLNGTYFSGGAGLSSTTRDYAIFLQMMLNKGVYNGKRILARRTVEMMTSNQLGKIDYGVNKFGLGFEITTAEGQAKLGVSEGSFSWGGYFATTYWADPKEKLVCLIYFQMMGMTHGEITDKFRALVYQALDD
jgi:CubicO group peptidase (beta-lactamase class C family)